MHELRTVSVISLLLLFGAPALAATQQDYDDCQQTSDVDRGIAACTRIVSDPSESAADRAAMYIRRGYDYLTKSDFNNAAADDSEAIKIEPRNAYAFANRAIAYARQGDRDKAIADYRKATGLNSSVVAGNADLQHIAFVDARRRHEQQRSGKFGALIEDAADQESFRFYAAVANMPAPQTPADQLGWEREINPPIVPSQSLQEAISLVDEVLLKTPSTRAWLTLARVHAGLGDRVEETHDFEEAVAREKQWPAGEEAYNIALTRIAVGDPDAKSAVENFVAAALALRARQNTLNDAEVGLLSLSLINAGNLLSSIGDFARANQILGYAKELIDNDRDHVHADALAGAFWYAGNAAIAWQILLSRVEEEPLIRLSWPILLGPNDTTDKVNNLVCGPRADMLERASAKFRDITAAWRGVKHGKQGIIPDDFDVYGSDWWFRLTDAIRVQIACGMRQRAEANLKILKDSCTSQNYPLPADREDCPKDLMEFEAALQGRPEPNRANPPQAEGMINDALRRGDFEAAIAAMPKATQGGVTIVRAAAAANRFDVVRRVVLLERIPNASTWQADLALRTVAHMKELPRW